jgi:hypothetical protein
MRSNSRSPVLSLSLALLAWAWNATTFYAAETEVPMKAEAATPQSDTRITRAEVCRMMSQALNDRPSERKSR